ncbi:MAG: hypothetical protein WCO65_01000 [bacterium]
MRHDFAKNVQVAINFLHNYEEDGILMMHNWKNFVWFRGIQMESVKEIGNDTSGGSVFKILERKIVFYGHKEIVLAEVVVRGNEFTNSDQSKPTFWKVTKIGYRKEYDESKLYDEYRWIEIEVEGPLM